MLTALPCQADRESLARLEEHSKTEGLDKLETLPSTLVGHLDPMLLAFTMICLLDTSPKLHVKQLIASILATVLLMKPAATCACLMPGQRSEEEEISSHSLRLKLQLAMDAKFHLKNSTPAFHPSSSGWLRSKPANEHEHPTSLTAQTDDHLFEHAKLEVSNF